MLPIACTRISKAEADRGQNRVAAVAARLVHHVADIVDHISVVARPAKHLVGTNTPVQRVAAVKTRQHVGAAIANHDVVERIARRTESAQSRSASGSRCADGMNGIGKAEADRGLNRVAAVATRLVDHVADIVDHIGVVASAAKHLVGTGTAIQRVVTA